MDYLYVFHFTAFCNPLESKVTVSIGELPNDYKHCGCTYRECVYRNSEECEVYQKALDKLLCQPSYF